MSNAVFEEVKMLKGRWGRLHHIDDSSEEALAAKLKLDEEWHIGVAKAAVIDKTWHEPSSLPDMAKISKAGKQALLANIISPVVGSYAILRIDTVSPWTAYAIPKVRYEAAEIAEIVRAYKCSRCNTILASKSSSHKNTAKCKVVDEQIELKAAGYVCSFARYVDAKILYEFGYKTDSTGSTWIPNYIDAAYKQYQQLKQDNSDIVMKPGKNGSFISLRDWISRVSGSTTTTISMMCSVAGCKDVGSSSQPSIKYSATTYSYCNTHGEELLDITATFNEGSVNHS